MRLVSTALVAAAVVFCAVQDRETAAGVGRYVAAQRAALAGRGPRVTIDEVMQPAIRRSVRVGLAWGGVAAVAGAIGAAAVCGAAVRGAAITRRQGRG